ncbi:metallophosphoesterase [Notoacmeibacter sp. MSK16QG-6]|uniref:metallophosphoesterase n=1 Tax=Notoacmeibacter sp. MSK16QG-6 TaxID=2957982 RepID=UPI0020A1879E|nr:metallophosphoesterase [Notoacmeibacter sp. MSK16QG-6]MCP1199901.1 metallophosphoesterase [Notoacmeibacter sp. MSK16QG-6]
MALTFAVGDIHGEISKMDLLLMNIERHASGGTVVFIGDYVDRGPNSAAVLQRLIDGPPDGWRWVVLPGNHEAMMIDGARADPDSDKSSLWLMNGGEETLASYPDGKVSDDHLRFIDGLDLLYRDEHRIYGHAYYDAGRTYEDQQAKAVLWERFSPSDTLDAIAPLHFVHGHTPRASNPTTRGNRTNVDSGAVYGGPLSAAVFDDEKAGPPIGLLQTR